MTDALARMAYALADRACIADIETGGIPTRLDGLRWYDTRPMLDLNEHAPVIVEMTQQALAYADLRGLFTRHPLHRHLVRIVIDPDRT